MISVHTEAIGKDFRIKTSQGNGRLRHVTKVALDDVSLDVEAGEVFGIIGRNGSGKSTLLKILSRIVTPTRGTARVYGTVAALLEVGTGMHPEMTGRENIFLNGALLGMSKADIRARFDEIVDFAGVPEYIDTPIKRYSSGMRLRLAFAVAAFLMVDVMIVDEVLAVGDARFQARCMGAMRDSVHSGRTVLFVSHNMAAIEGLCSRVAWLDRGRVARVGAADEVVREYLQSSLATAEENARVFDGGPSPSGAIVRATRIAVAAEDDGALMQGGDFFVALHLSVDEPVRGLKVGVKITTLEDFPVCSMSSGDYGLEWDLDPGSYLLRVRFTSARLLPRPHKLSAFTYTKWPDEIIEQHVDVLTFHVMERDVLGTGKPIRADRGVTWIPAEFSLSTIS